MIYFTADLHLGHENVIKYCQRPFKNVEEMNRILISRYNKRVTNEDTVYFIGDLSLSNNRNVVGGFVSRLRGEKYLILGNHDRLRPFEYVDIGFRSVHTLLVVEEFVLNHDPVVCIVDSERKFLCGHVHDLFVKIKNVLNVGVDVWDFQPVSIEEVRGQI